MTKVSIVKNYEDAFLDRGQWFGIKFARGWCFARVVGFENTIKYPFNRYQKLSSRSSSVVVGSGTSSDTWWVWEDRRSGKDLFWEYNTNYVLHVMIGIAPKRLRLFRRYPDPYARGNLSKIKVDAVPTAESMGYIDGGMSPYDNPSSLSEMFVPKELLVKHAVFNPEGYDVIPRFNVYIRRLKVQWLNIEKAEDAKMIENIIKRKVRAKLWTPGVEAFEYDSENKLLVKPVSW